MVRLSDFTGEASFIRMPETVGIARAGGSASKKELAVMILVGVGVEIFGGVIDLS